MRGKLRVVKVQTRQNVVSFQDSSSINTPNPLRPFVKEHQTARNSQETHDGPGKPVKRRGTGLTRPSTSPPQRYSSFEVTCIEYMRDSWLGPISRCLNLANVGTVVEAGRRFFHSPRLTKCRAVSLNPALRARVLRLSALTHAEDIYSRLESKKILKQWNDEGEAWRSKRAALVKTLMEVCARSPFYLFVWTDF